jgi:ATP-dependent Lon protease
MSKASNIDGQVRVSILLLGVERVILTAIQQHAHYKTAAFDKATVTYPTDESAFTQSTTRLKATFTELLDVFSKLDIPRDAIDTYSRLVQHTKNTNDLVDIVAGAVEATFQERIALLNCLNVDERCTMVQDLMTKQIHALQVTHQVQNSVRQNMTKAQREFYLRQQLKAIQKELGEDNSVPGDDWDERVKKARLPPHVAKAAKREVARLQRVPSSSPESNVIQTYLECLLEVPWMPVVRGEPAPSMDLAFAQKQLDADHYGLEMVKRRIVEYMAVAQLRTRDNKQIRSPILCLVGAPGVGKTSLGKSIAKAMGREFVRVSLGGLRDEAEIRGHRRTYVGALPGKVVQGMRKCGVNNPVMLLDEIDKVGERSFQGDPSAALLEVLDPEQNSTFTDHYLALELDLSNVLFICTANRLDTIPPALLDRMEVLNLPGYTVEEKVAIAKRYLLVKQANQHGMDPLVLPDEVLQHAIQRWTREAGVRQLERVVEALYRARAMHVIQGTSSDTTVHASDLPVILGPEKYDSELASQTAVPGLVTGLAYNQSGSGSIMFVECAFMPGKGNLVLTGQLGQVLQESAKLAQSWIRSNLAHLIAKADVALDTKDIHIHCPSGAIPKDGPSAGITLTMALLSLVVNQPVPPWIGMTGEITLRGLILPIGGVREKLVAAKSAGLQKVLLPLRNKRDYEMHVGSQVKDALQVVFIETIWDAVRECFDLLPHQLLASHL